VVIVSLVAGPAYSGGESPPARLTEQVEVSSFYLCDGYASFGDATFYDCARRFFREATRPVATEVLTGRWICRSAFNGPSVHWEQPLLVAEYGKKATTSRAAIDELLVTSTHDRLSARKLHERLGRSFCDGRVLIRTMAAQIMRADEEWISTEWGYGEIPVGLDLMGTALRTFYEQRTAFRMHRGRLLLEHVVGDEERERLLGLLKARLPVPAQERQSVEETVNRLAQEMLLEGKPLYSLRWTEQSLLSATPVARYDDGWTLPVMYSECRRAGRW
jgi:hypothetical protein